MSKTLPTKARPVDIEPLEARANFERWFSGSKVVDARGLPLVLYHGTKAKFLAFDEDRIEHFGFHVGTLTQARAFGPKPLELFVAIRNPVVLPDLGMWGFENLARHLDSRGLGILDDEDYERAWGAFDQPRELRRILLEKGFDGVRYRNEVEGEGESFIAFRPNQLKSASQNSGGYSPGDDDITDGAAVAGTKVLASRARRALQAIPGNVAAGSVRTVCMEPM